MACTSGEETHSADDTTGVASQAAAFIEFDRTTHDFGTLTQGEKVEISFQYKNTGRQELKIVNADSDCGCSVPEWSKEKLPQGESAKLKVIFDTQGLIGNVLKTVTITTNTGQIQEIQLIALIKSPHELIINN